MSGGYQVSRQNGNPGLIERNEAVAASIEQLARGEPEIFRVGYSPFLDGPATLGHNPAFSRTFQFLADGGRNQDRAKKPGEQSTCWIRTKNSSAAWCRQ